MKKTKTPAKHSHKHSALIIGAVAIALVLGILAFTGGSLTGAYHRAGFNDTIRLANITITPQTISFNSPDFNGRAFGYVFEITQPASTPDLEKLVFKFADGPGGTSTKVFVAASDRTPSPLAEGTTAFFVNGTWQKVRSGSFERAIGTCATSSVYYNYFSSVNFFYPHINNAPYGYNYAVFGSEVVPQPAAYTNCRGVGNSSVPFTWFYMEEYLNLARGAGHWVFEFNRTNGLIYSDYYDRGLRRWRGATVGFTSPTGSKLLKADSTGIKVQYAYDVTQRRVTPLNFGNGTAFNIPSHFTPVSPATPNIPAFR